MLKHSRRQSVDRAWDENFHIGTYINTYVVRLTGILSEHIYPGQGVHVRENNTVNKYGVVAYTNQGAGFTDVVIYGIVLDNVVNMQVRFGIASPNNRHLAGSFDNIHVNNLFVEKGQGGQMCWNVVQGQGKTTFMNNRGGGSGGFSFYNGTNSSYTMVVDIDAAGNVRSYSDENLKSGFEKITNAQGIRFIEEVEPFNYLMWGETPDLGFKAGKIKALHPLLTGEAEEGMTLNYLKVPVVQQAALRGLLDRVKKLEQQAGIEVTYEDEGA